MNASLNKFSPQWSMDMSTWEPHQGLLSLLLLIDAGSQLLEPSTLNLELLLQVQLELERLNQLKILQKDLECFVLCSIAQTRLIL